MDLFPIKRFRRLKILNALQEGQFILHYQPRLDVKSGMFLSAEALVRWEKSGEVVYPGEFISVIENSKMRSTFNEWLLRTVIDQCKQWQERDVQPLRISINIDARDLNTDVFEKYVQQILQATGFDPRNLELEVVERYPLKEKEEVFNRILKFKKMGIRIAIDDFGTGYSSLAYLKDYPVDLIKLDQTFIRDITTNGRSQEIVKSLIALAHALRLRVVAEGVEAYEQMEILYELQCDEIQGYLISHPIPGHEFETFLLEHKNDHRRVLLPKSRYFTIPLKNPLEAQLTIIQINQRPIMAGITKILITEIGPGHLQFLSNLVFPVDSNALFQIDTELFADQWIQLHGHIVDITHKEEIMQQYRLEIVADEDTRQFLIKTFNQFAIYLKKKPQFLRLYMGDKQVFFRQAGQKSKGENGAIIG